MQWRKIISPTSKTPLVLTPLVSDGDPTTGPHWRGGYRFSSVIGMTPLPFSLSSNCFVLVVKMIMIRVGAYTREPIYFVDGINGERATTLYEINTGEIASLAS